MPDRRVIERKRESDEAFQSFWNAYPRKVGRVDAVKAWNQLRPDAATVQAMLDALAWQREQWDNPKYIPHPASWIRGERWTDEAPQAAEPKTMSGASAAVLRLMKRPAL